MNRPGYALLCVLMLTFRFGTGQVTIQSMPEFGNKFAASQFVSENDMKMVFISAGSNELFVVDGNQTEITTNSASENKNGNIYGRCINCGDYKIVQLPQHLTIANFDTSIINLDCASIANARLNSFVILNKKNESKDVYVSVGVDGSLVAYGNMNKLTSYVTEEGRTLDFLNIDISKLKSLLKVELSLSDDTNTSSIDGWEIQGEFVKKVSDSKYLFDWIIILPAAFGNKSRYLVRTIVDDRMNFTIEHYLNLDRLSFVQNINQSTIDTNCVRHLYETSGRKTRQSDSEGSGNIGERTYDWEEAGQFRIDYDEVVTFVTISPENETFRVEVDSLNFPDKQKFEYVIPDWYGIMRGDLGFFEIRNLSAESGDSSGMAKLNLFEKQSNANLAWRDWRFLGYSILSAQEGSIQMGLDNAQNSESSFEMVRHSAFTSDTLKIKYQTPMFFQHYCITKDGHLHILAQSRFSVSNFGASVYRFLARGSSKTKGIVAYYNGLNENIVSCVSHFEIPMNGELDLDRFSSTTACDISDINSTNNHFKAIFKSDNDILGSLEIGLYKKHQLTHQMTPRKVKKRDAVYILIGGYVFKYNERSRVFWIGDGTKLKSVKTLNEAVDISVRSFLSLQYNVDHRKPICYER